MFSLLAVLWVRYLGFSRDDLSAPCGVYLEWFDWGEKTKGGFNLDIGGFVATVKLKHLEFPFWFLSPYDILLTMAFLPTWPQSWF